MSTRAARPFRQAGGSWGRNRGVGGEDDVEAGRLADYDVLYTADPCVHEKAAERIAAWVRSGGHLVATTAAGFFVAGVDVGESWGSPAGRAAYDEFHASVARQFGFSPKACLFCVSRGGLIAYNWAAERPDRVQCIGGIYPLCNLRTFPGIDRVTEAYGVTERQLRAELGKHNPVDRLAPLAAAGVPILHVHGNRDTAVPLASNSAELARRYQALGGQAEVIVIHGKGHEVAPELWREPRGWWVPNFWGGIGFRVPV